MYQEHPDIRDHKKIRFNSCKMPILFMYPVLAQINQVHIYNQAPTGKNNQRTFPKIPTHSESHAKIQFLRDQL